MAAWIKIEDIFFTYDTYLFSFHWILLNHSERKTIIWEGNFCNNIKVYVLYFRYLLFLYFIAISYSLCQYSFLTW